MMMMVIMTKRGLNDDDDGDDDENRTEVILRTLSYYQSLVGSNWKRKNPPRALLLDLLTNIFRG